LIISILAALSLRNTKANIFETKLLNFLQSIGLENSLHSAQLLMPLSMQHMRILHHVAFVFPAQPGHLPLMYERQPAQYNPQNDTISGFTCIVSLISE
jgi:hypothetical protein